MTLHLIFTCQRTRGSLELRTLQVQPWYATRGTVSLVLSRVIIVLGLKRASIQILTEDTGTANTSSDPNIHDQVHVRIVVDNKNNDFLCLKDPV